MKEDLEYRDLGNYPSYDIFIKNGSFFILIETLETFFRCKAIVYSRPLREIKKNFDIDILKNPRRGCYPIDDDNVVIVARILDGRKLISAIAYHLNSDRICENKKLLNTFEGVLTATFTQEFTDRFRLGVLAFGDELIKRTITNYICQGYYDFRNIRHLIEYFFKLRTTSFEGAYFSTGALITKALHDYTDKKNSRRNGNCIPLSKWIRLENSNIIDKRIWYLADGKKTFFLGTKSLDFTSLFVLNSSYSTSTYVDSHILSLTLKGGDTLFKIENEKLFSINTSGGFEFTYFENKWMFRNYNFIKKLIEENISTDQMLIDSLLFYTLICSKKQISEVLPFSWTVECHFIMKRKFYFKTTDGNIHPAVEKSCLG